MTAEVGAPPVGPKTDVVRSRPPMTWRLAAFLLIVHWETNAPSCLRLGPRPLTFGQHWMDRMLEKLDARLGIASSLEIARSVPTLSQKCDKCVYTH